MAKKGFDDKSPDLYRVGDVDRLNHHEIIMLDMGMTRRIRQLLKDPYVGIEHAPRNPLEMFGGTRWTMLDLEQTPEDFMKVRKEVALRYKISYENAQAKVAAEQAKKPGEAVN